MRSFRWTTQILVKPTIPTPKNQPIDLIPWDRPNFKIGNILRFLAPVVARLVTVDYYAGLALI